MLIIVDRFEGDYVVLLEEKGCPEAGTCCRHSGGRCCFSGYGRHLEKGYSGNGKKKISDSKKDGRIMGIK